MSKAILNCHDCAGSFAWCFFFLHAWPNRQDKLSDELAEACGHSPTRWRDSGVHPGRDGLHSLGIHSLFLFSSFFFLCPCIDFFSVRRGSFRAALTRTSCCSSNSQVSQWERSAGRLRVHAAGGGSAQRWWWWCLCAASVWRLEKCLWFCAWLQGLVN